MVRRFESVELRQQAREHEALWAPSGCVGFVLFLLGLALVGIGMMGCFRPLWNWSSPAVAGPHLSWDTPSPAPAPTTWPDRSPAVDRAVEEERPTASGGSLDGGWWSSSTGDAISRARSLPLLAPEEMRHLGVDSSLVGICVAVVAICILPACFRDCASFSASAVPPAGGLAPTGCAYGSGGYGYGGGGYCEPTWSWTSWFWWWLTSWLPFGSSLWRPAAESLLTPMTPGGSGWLRADGSVHGTGIPGFGAGYAAPGFGGQAGSAWTGPSSAPWGAGGLSGYGMFGAGGRRRAVPSEAEVSETYQVYGAALQNMVAGFAVMLEQQVLAPFLVELEQSDRLWQEALPRHGYHLTLEPPRVPGSLGLGGPSSAGGFMGSRPQGLSVFDRELPPPLRNEAQAVRLWHHRQVLESYLQHPGFRCSPEQRIHVLGRLQEWRCRGLARSLQPPRFEWTTPTSLQQDAIPTDAHILENLFIKVMDAHLDFASSFMAVGEGTPMARNLGRVPPAYMRQVMDQSTSPKASPHYEVVTLTKVWKLRAGSANILEALCLLLLLLRREAPGADRSFPVPLRTLANSAPLATAVAPPSSYGLGQGPSLWNAQPWRTQPPAATGGMGYGGAVGSQPTAYGTGFGSQPAASTMTLGGGGCGLGGGCGATDLQMQQQMLQQQQQQLKQQQQQQQLFQQQQMSVDNTVGLPPGVSGAQVGGSFVSSFGAMPLNGAAAAPWRQ